MTAQTEDETPDVRYHTLMICITDTTVAIEAELIGITVGGDTLSGLAFEDNFGSILKTPE